MSTIRDFFNLIISLSPAGFFGWLVVEGMPYMKYLGFAGLAVGVAIGAYYGRREPERSAHAPTHRKRWPRAVFLGASLLVLAFYVHLRFTADVLNKAERIAAYGGFTYLAGIVGAAIAYVCFMSSRRKNASH